MTDPSQLDAARAQIIELEERREDAVQKYVKYLGLYTETAAECDNLRTALVDLIGAIDNDGRSVLVPTTTRELAGEELMKECTCVKCGWVHMAYTRKQAQDEVNRFNAAYEKMSPETQALYSGPVAIENYEGCRRCGGRRFREAREDDCPAGVTISPVIWES